MYSTHAVEETSLGTELEPVKDREVIAIDGGEAASLGAKQVGACGVTEVLSKPHGAESLLHAIVTLGLAARVFPLDLLQLLAAHLVLLFLA